MEKKILITLVVAAVVILAAVAAAILLMGGKESAVYYLTVPPKDMKASLSTGAIDAYIAWEPYVSDSVVGGVGDVIMWSGDIMPNHPCCVVAVSNDFLASANGPELTERFIRAHMDATTWMNEALADHNSANYTLLVNMAVQFTQRDAAVVEAAFEHIIYRYDMGSEFRSALEQFTDMYMNTSMTTSQKLTDRGYSSTTDFINKYVDGSYLAAAASVAPSATILNPSSPIRLGYLLGDLHQMAQVVAQNKTLLGTGKSMFETYGLLITDATGAPFGVGGDVMNGFAAGAVDIGYLGAPPALLNHLNAGVSTKIISQVNSEGSGIVVKDGLGITDLSGLLHKTVATPGESSIQFLLLKIALQREGLALKIKT